jgi:hypothetical protein
VWAITGEISARPNRLTTETTCDRSTFLSVVADDLCAMPA